MAGLARLEVNPLGPVHEYTIGGFPPVTVEVKFKVPLLQMGEAAGELLAAVAEKGTLASVPNEISSKPKSLPLASVLRFLILMTAVVEAPEFHIGVL